MEKCRLYHNNKMKIGDSTVLKVETISDDDGAHDYEYTYLPDIPVDKTTVPEQDVIDNKGNPINGLNHIVNSYTNMEVRLPSGRKSFIGKSLDFTWIKM